ncbi:MAG: B12-binding domain-containing radical SAM protein [Candidatus Helarchaeota archaeon]
MKVLFLQRDIWGKLSIMLLSAILKKAGHKCDVLVDDLEENLVEKALKINPDIIAFSISVNEITWMQKVGTQLRVKFKKLIICGGPCATIYYDEILNEEFLDIICIGEGDEAILELVNTINEKGDITNIKNLIVKQDGKIYKNDVRPLISDLDSLPFLDRTIYDRYAFFRNPKNIFFTLKNLVMTSRGCPYNCTFCFNKQYNEIYKGKGKIFRRRSVSNVIEELRIIKQQYPKYDFITFPDDIFLMPPRTWVNNFLERYQMEINIPFSCSTRANLLDEDLVKRLQSANCYSIRLGIESSNDYIRNTIFKKGIKLKQIIRSSYLIKKYGIKLQTYNILGAPTETLKTALETYELNRKIRPTCARCHPLFPYPKTEIYEYALKNNYLEEEINIKKMNYLSLRPMSILIKLKNKEEIDNLQKIFSFGVLFNLPPKLVKFLIKLPLSKFKNLFFGVSLISILGLIQIYHLSIRNSLKVALSYLLKYT